MIVLSVANNISFEARTTDIWNVCIFLIILFDLTFYVNGKQLRSGSDGKLLNNTVPWQAPGTHFTSIKCPFSAINFDILLFLNQWKRETLSTKEIAGCEVYGVRVSVTYHLTCVNIIFSSVSVAEWPPFGK